MALNQNTLKDALVDLGDCVTEAEAVEPWADAFNLYFQGAETLGVPVTPGSTSPARDALAAAAVGASTPGAGAGKLAAGMGAYWGQVASLAASIWPGTLAAVPPGGLAGLQAALEANFAANTAGGVTRGAAAAAVASTVHGCNAGGIANWPPPPAGPGPQPIL